MRLSGCPISRHCPNRRAVYTVIDCCSGPVGEVDPGHCGRKVKKKIRHLTIALVFLLALAMGCASTIEGKRIDGAKTKNLIAEGTTTDDVVKMFGEPQQKENLPSGETKYVYYYRTSQDVLFFPKKADPQEQQRLEVFLKGNQVERYRYWDNDVQPITTDVPPLQPDKK
jgi:hypothetical protein